jgi:hypothetical protein
MPHINLFIKQFEIQQTFLVRCISVLLLAENFVYMGFLTYLLSNKNTESFNIFTYVLYWVLYFLGYVIIGADTIMNTNEILRKMPGQFICWGFLRAFDWTYSYFQLTYYGVVTNSNYFSYLLTYRIILFCVNILFLPMLSMVFSCLNHTKNSFCPHNRIIPIVNNDISVVITTNEQNYPIEQYVISNRMLKHINNRSHSDEMLEIEPISHLNVMNFLKKQHECCICLTNYVENDELNKLKCTHMFHKKCLMTWLMTNQTCPICRSYVY